MGHLPVLVASPGSQSVVIGAPDHSRDTFLVAWKLHMAVLDVALAIIFTFLSLTSDHDLYRFFLKCEFFSELLIISYNSFIF